MKTFATVVCVFALMVCVWAEQEDFKPPTVAVIGVESAPVLDGKLDDPCWKEAFEVSQFHLVGKDIRAKYPTSMMLVSTSKALYLGIRCSKGKPPAKYEATAGARDGDVFLDDSIELFLQPEVGSDKYYQFVANPEASQYDGLGRDRSWDGRWRAVARRSKEAWVLELEISYSSFKCPAPGRGDEWGFSIVRNEVGGKEFTCWADLSGGYHEPASFGRIVFRGPLAGKPRLAIVAADGVSPLYIAPQNIGVDLRGLKAPAKLADVGRLNIVNGSFEDGLSRWSVQFPERTYSKSPVSVESVARGEGEHALCVESVNPHANVTVWQKVWAPPEGRFEVECRIKPGNTAERGAVRLFVDHGSHENREHLGLHSTIVADEAMKEGWYRRAVRFTVPGGVAFVRVGIELLGYRGKVWADGFVSRRAKRPERPADGIWHWDATWDGPDGNAPRARLYSLMEKKSPFLDRAQRFNDLLVDAAFALDEMKSLDRACHYIGKKPQADYEGRMGKLMDGLDRVNRAYARAYLDGGEAELPGSVDGALKELRQGLTGLRADVKAEMKGVIAEARKTLGEWPPPPTPREEGPFRLAPDGSSDQLIFGTWGKWQYKELGRKLDVWKLTSNDGPAKPKALPDGSLSWEPLLDYLATLKQAGVPYYGVRSAILRGRDTWVSPAFAKANADKPDYKTGRKWNLWHPAVVKEQTRFLASLARQTRDKPEVLFNQFAWEYSAAQYLDTSVTDPAKSTGLARFQEYLRRTYGNIGALNSAWKTKHKSFAAVVPSGKLDTRACPLRYEYNRWRQEYLIGLLKLFYETLKKEDPAKPVLSSHTRLFYRIDPTRIFETCDLIDAHGPDRNISINMYLASNAPLAGKRVCKFENFWQYQDETHRWGDERSQFSQMAKYVYRNTLMGMNLQFFCFPYTSQLGWNWRQAQWCQLATDYTTMRWAACALPMAKSRVKGLDEVFTRARPAPSKLLLVFPQTSFMHLDNLIYEEIRSVVKALHSDGRTFAYRSEAHIASGQEKLGCYGAVVLMRSPFLADGVGGKLLEWVKAGGALIAIGPAGVYDKHGFGDGALMRDSVGVVPKPPEGNWRSLAPWDFGAGVGDASIVDKPCGKGRVFVVNMDFREFLLSGSDTGRLFAALEKAAPKEVVCEGASFEVWRLVTPEGGHYLGLVNPNPDVDLTAIVRVRCPVKRVTDWSIAGGFPVPIARTDEGARFNIKLQPGGMALLRMEK